MANARDLPVAGRIVGKQLVISAQNSKEDRATEARLSIISPGIGTDADLTIGTFSSKPIKVISKPNKKASSNRKGTRKYVHHSGLTFD